MVAGPPNHLSYLFFNGLPRMGETFFSLSLRTRRSLFKACTGEVG
jgi:hypothetical protein